MKISFKHERNDELASFEHVRGVSETQRIVDAIRHPTTDMGFDRMALVALEKLQKKLIAEPLEFSWMSVAATIAISKEGPTLTLAIEPPCEVAVPVGTWQYLSVNGEYLGLREGPWGDEGAGGVTNFLHAALRQAWERRLRVAA